jgi:hypothetical protein
MEQFGGDTPAEVPVTNIAPPADKPMPRETREKFVWQEALEKITPADIKTFTNEVVQTVSSRLAEQIISRLDQKIIYQLLKESMDGALKNLLEKKSQ